MRPAIRGASGRHRFAVLNKHHRPTPNVPTPSDLLTPAGAAAELHVTARTVRQWIAVGRLRALRTDPGRGGRLLVRRADLLALLQPVTAGGAA